MDLVIFGAGGFGREAADVVEAVNRVAPTYTFLGFVDDGSPDLEVLGRRGACHLGGSAELERWRGAGYLVGVGAAEARARLDDQARAAGLVAATAVHPASVQGVDVRLGPGTVLCAGSVITTNVVLGRHVHLNLNSTIGHDCVVGDYVTINPGANISGDVTLEPGVTVGTGASVIQGLTIGAGATVGAGAVVVRDVAPGLTVVGVPARPVPR